MPETTDGLTRASNNRYQSGFGNEFATEALPGVLPIGRNSPQQVARGLYADQLSGTAFTAPRAHNRRSWLYRIRPAAVHKEEGFVPGGASLHNCMSGHGPDAETFRKASASDTTKPHKVDNTLAFMFETPRVIRPTAFALETSQLQAEYFECWQGLRKNFKAETQA